MALRFRSPRAYRAIAWVKEQGLTYLTNDQLLDLAYAALQARRDRGVLIEAGTAAGGSALVLAAAKHPSQSLFLYDTFGMIPPPSRSDDVDVWKRYEQIESGAATGIRGRPYYGYETNLLQKITDFFTEFGLDVRNENIHLVKGLYEETLRLDVPVSFAHLDCDWYESVKTCLERIHPHMQVGSRFVIDDYESWSGCKKAVDEFLDENGDKYAVSMHARLHLLKKG